MRFAVLSAGLGLVFLALGAGPAAAKSKPCWQRVLNDWTADGRIDGVYPRHCYRDALRHLPDDLKTYTNIVERITNARQQQVHVSAQRANGEPSRSIAGSNGTRRGSAGTERRVAEPPRGLFGRAFDTVGPRNADSVPLPLLILAGLALLLIAAGGAGLISKRLRARRVHTPTP